MSDNRWVLAGFLLAVWGCNSAPTQPQSSDEADSTVKVEELARVTARRADVLFVIDNSGSMREEQAALRAQIPRLVQALSTGDVNGDGEAELPAFAEVRLGVVSSDMGLYGVEGISGCDGLGDDGRLQHATPEERAAAGEAVDPAVLQACTASYPQVIGYTSEGGDLEQVASDFGCMAALGTDGCGFEQPLEAALKAAWPGADDSLLFLAPEGDDRGHGDTHNAALFETDPDDPSLLIVVVLTDEEDCSSEDTSHLVPPNQLEPSDLLAMQDLNLRCFYNKANLYPTERYVEQLRALRPGHPELVIFGVIAGVPTDLVDGSARAEVDFDDAEQRDAYYDSMLGDERMIENIDPTRNPGEGNLVPSCSVDGDGDETVESRAYPPRRLVDVARGFGPNGFVQSICQPDLGPAMEALMTRVADRMVD